MNQELSTTVGRLIETYFPQLRRTVRKNLTRLTCAFLRLALSVRFGYGDRKSTRLNSSHSQISYAVFCLKKKNTQLHHLLVVAFLTDKLGQSRSLHSID